MHCILYINMEQLEREYNAGMASLVELVYNKCRSDPNIADARVKFATIRSHTPSEIIKTSGPPLWEHRERIANGEASFFLKMECDDSDEASMLVSSIKRLWTSSNDAERDYVVAVLKKLLSLYAKYLLLCQK